MKKKDLGYLSDIKFLKSKYYLFLNPYTEYAFTKCPKCRIITKIRKYCLVINVKPNHFIILNMTCNYCPDYDLIIVKKREI